mgnify:CR=1 FL=1
MNNITKKEATLFGQPLFFRKRLSKELFGQPLF